MTLRVLVIEDNPANLALVEYLLRARGHEPVTATDGAEGLRLAKELGPDLIVCDLEMPVMNGYEVIRQLRADPLLRSIPVAAVTAFSMPGDRKKAIDAGFDEHLSKPIDPETFVASLENLVRAR